MDISVCSAHDMPISSACGAAADIVFDTPSCRGLVVLGSASTLSKSEHWRQWLRWVKARSAITTEDALLASVYATS